VAFCNGYTYPEYYPSSLSQGCIAFIQATERAWALSEKVYLTPVRVSN
jgi:hypothetical protein